MPGKKSYKKRKYTKKAVKIPRTPSRLSYPGTCPDVMAVQLKYSRSGAFSGAGPQTIVFRANGPFDPEFAVGGGQPNGYDQWSAFYRRYRVIASKVVMRAGTIATGNSSGIIVTPLNTSSIQTNPQDYLENTNAKQADNVGTAGMGSMSITHYKSTAAMRGGPYDLVQYETDLSALISANPTQGWFWHCTLYNADGTTGSVDANINITVTYYVEFYDRETLTTS